MTKRMQAVPSVFVMGCLVFLGCSSPPKNVFYLRDETNGFIQGPFFTEENVTPGVHTLRAVFPTNEELATLETLRTTVVKFQPFCLEFEKVIEELNDALNGANDAQSKVSIRVEFPPSWDLPQFSAEELKRWGYKEGFGGSRKSNLPKVSLNTAGELSVYNILHALPVIWSIPIRFSIDGETAVLTVADYDDVCY